MPLDPGIAAALQQMAAAGLPPVSSSDPQTARAVLRQISLGGGDPTGGFMVDAVRSSLVSDNIPVRVYTPDHADPIPTIVLFHGGGFVMGDLDTHDAISRRLSNDISAVVVSVDYRLAPEHPFPAAVDDANTACRWVIAHIDEFGGDPRRVVLAGDSAGANLATVAAQSLTAEGIPVAAQLLLYPPTDPMGDYPSITENAEGYFLTRADMEWFFSHYLGLDSHDPKARELAADPRISPMLAPDLSGLPPAIIATAEFDPLRDDGDAYAAALSAAGVRVEHRQFAGLIHGFWGMGATSAGAEEATRWIAATLRSLLV